MKILNKLHLDTAKIIVVLKKLSSPSQLTSYAKRAEEHGVDYKSILYVELGETDKKSLRDSYDELLELCNTKEIYTVVDESKGKSGSTFINGYLFTNLFGKDSSLWKELGVYYKDGVKFILNDRWESIARESKSSTLVDSEFKLDHSKINIIVIKTLPELKKIVKKIAKTKRAYGDIEANTLRFEEKTAKVLTIQWTPDEEPLTSYVLIFDHPQVPVSNEYKEFMSDLHRKILEKKEVAFHNGLFDLKFLCRFFDVDPLDVNLEDTYVMHRLLNNSTDESGKRKMESGLKKLAFEFLGDWDSELDKYKKEYCQANGMKLDDFTYDLFPVDMLVEYAGYDTIALRAVYYKLQEMNKNHRIPNLLENSWYDTWKDITISTTKMVMNGIPLDIEKAKEMAKEFAMKIDKLDNEIKEDATIKKVELKLSQKNMKKAIDKYNSKVAKAKEKGKPFKGKYPSGDTYDSIKLKPEFNAQSAEHKAVLLFDQLKLKPLKYSSKTKLPSADKDTFEYYMKERRDIPILALFNERAKYYKELTSYLEPWVRIAENSYTGRVHADWFLDTVSFRYVSKNPNLQQLKKDSDLKELLTYSPEDRRVILQMDYSALEDRLGIILDKDPNKLKLFKSGIEDNHSVNAITSSVSDKFAELRGLDPTNIKHIKLVKEKYDKLRSAAKSITFLAQYLGTHYKLVKELDIDKETAKKIMDDYWNFRKGMREYIDNKMKSYAENGYTVVFGGVPVQIHGMELMKGFDTLNEFQEYVDTVWDKKPYLDAMSTFRTAFNAETQSGAWATKTAKYELNKWIKETGTDAKVIMEVHDAIYADVSVDDLMLTYNKMKELMERPIVENQVIDLDTEAEVGYSVKGELGKFEGENRDKILKELTKS